MAPPAVVTVAWKPMAMALTEPASTTLSVPNAVLLLANALVKYPIEVPPEATELILPNATLLFD